MREQFSKKNAKKIIEIIESILELNLKKKLKKINSKLESNEQIKSIYDLSFKEHLNTDFIELGQIILKIEKKHKLFIKDRRYEEFSTIKQLIKEAEK